MAGRKPQDGGPFTTTCRDHDWINPDVKIRSSSIHGRGMFALRVLAPGVVIAVWGGQNVSLVAAEERRAAGNTVQQIEEDVFDIIDRSNRGPSYYQNHSCEPNTGMKDEATVVALRPIQPGEELTLDYAMTELDESWVMPWECRCGSSWCRKTITGKDWRLQALQDRYGAYFTPLLRRRVASQRAMG